MKTKTGLAVTMALFAVLAAIYFIPKFLLGLHLPYILVKYRITGPLLTLALAGIFMLPWKVTLAMAFSLVGDFMGAYGSFIGQMGFFACVHAMLICYYLERLKSLPKSRRTICVSAVIFVILTAFAMTQIIPHAPAGTIRTGCAVYALLICTMLSLALLQKAPMIAIGAALFLLSDMILSWNKFVSPIGAHNYLIMIPYYAGQLLIWLGVYQLRKKNISNS